MTGTRNTGRTRIEGAYRMRRTGFSLALVLATAMAGFVAPANPARAESEADRLAAERARWEAARIADYEYGYRKYCECYRDEPPVTVVTVRDGQAQHVHHRYRNPDHEVAVDDDSAAFYWTIDELFARLASALARDAVVRAEYDAELGYPTSIFIDDDPDFDGGETDFRGIEVEPL
jgi:Family of unknown function (DUF6174)